MASLSDTLIANGAQQLNKGVDVAGDLQSGVAAGIQLATAKEQVEQKKVQLEQQKAELVMKQATSANALLTNLARANPLVAKKMLPQVREKLLNLGASPEIADYTISDDATRQRQIAFSQYAAGKLSSDPKAAQGYYSKLGELMGYDEAAQKFDSEIKFRNEMAKQNDQQVSQERIAGMSAAKAEKGADAKEEKDFKQALRLSIGKFEEMSKKDREALGTLKDAANLLSSGGPIEQNAARRALAKAYNSGALTDNDVNDFAGSKALTERFKQFLSTNAEGEITDENLAQLLEIAKKSGDRRKGTIEANAKDAAHRFQYTYGGDKEDLYKNAFYPTEFMGSLPSEKAKQNPDEQALNTINPKTGQKYTQAEINEYKKSKGIPVVAGGQ